MAAVDDGDDDLKLIRASAWAIKALQIELPDYVSGLLRAHEVGLANRRTTFIQESDRLSHKIDIFQEDPLVIDPYLRSFVHSLVDVLLLYISKPSAKLSAVALGASLESITSVLYHLCKVRGAKVIANLLNNEPRNLSRVLQAFQYSKGVATTFKGDDSSASRCEEVASAIRVSHQWTYRYILLLWASHLMLTPFDFSTVAAAPTLKFSVELPFGSRSLPDVTRQTIEAAFSSISSPTKDQSAAALVLAKLALRPDMTEHRLLSDLIDWACVRFLEAVTPETTIYEALGPLMVLGKITAAADSVMIAPCIPSIYDATLKLLDGSEVIGSSAVAKRLIIKIQRHLVQHLLRLNNLANVAGIGIAQRMLEERSVLEDVVDFFLRSLAERDTLLRMTASKSLSAIATNLQPEMCEQVVEAVLGSLQENVLTSSDGSKSLSAVSPIRWHGLMLTLGHMLFRRSASPTQLVDVLEALFLGLSFEQRSATGSSLGGNVRDAANFGLWSLARRYSTTQICSGDPNYALLRRTAAELLKAATLDPTGNVRRGSSAALQELAGRHPDTIPDGISLIQIVDFHSVGLAQRAMIEVAGKAARLANIYREAIVEGLLGWRGVSAMDASTRQHAASSMNVLTKSILTNAEISSVMSCLLSGLKKDGGVQERHGLLLMLSATVNAAEVVEEHTVSSFSALFEDPIGFGRKDLFQPSQRPVLSIEGILASFRALSARFGPSSSWGTKSVDLLRACVRNAYDDNLDDLSKTCLIMLPVIEKHMQDEAVQSWIKALKSNDRSSRLQGPLMAVGAAFAIVSSQVNAPEQHDHASHLPTAIVTSLIGASGAQHEIETRVVALKSMAHLIQPASTELLTTFQIYSILSSLYIGLNDYTINERGDVGSLLRLQAIKIIKMAAASKRFQGDVQLRSCLLSVVRLAFERLDKVRLEAMKCLSDFSTRAAETLTDVSEYDYFYGLTIDLLQSPLRDNKGQEANSQSLMSSLIEGISSSAGGGSDSILPLARAALFDVLDALPTVSPHATDDTQPSLLAIANTLLALFKEHASNDRVLVPLLETTSFLLDAGALDRLEPPKLAFRWRTLLASVQKAHFKTSNMPKIFAAIGVYRGLARVEAVKKDVLAKLVSMLAHPFAKVRDAAAETLFVVTGEDELRGREWSAPVARNSAIVASLKKRLC